MVLRLRGTHSLGDFLNDTFSLVPRIWKKALPVSLVALAPGVALLIAAITSLGSWIKSVAGEPASIGKDPSLVVSGLAPLLLLGMLASLALFLGHAFQKAFVCAHVGSAIEGREPGLRELTAAAFRPAWVRMAAQEAIVGALAYFIAEAAVGAILCPFLFGKLGDFARLGESGGPGIGFIASFIAVYLVSILVASAAIWWLRVKTCVAAPAVVLERVNPFAALGRSLELTRGKGWRTFGIMFIVSLVISFGLGILTGPITFLVLMPGYIPFLREALAGETPSPQAIIALVSSMSWAIGVTSLITGLVKGTLWPTFLTLLHSDLRIRAGEIEPWAESALE
jgi:hypothetical protein